MVNMFDTASSRNEKNNTKTVKNVPKIEVVNILNSYANGSVRKSNKFIRDCAEFGVN